MFRTKYLVLLAVGVALCAAVGAQARADSLLLDNFNTTNTGLNDDLATRQGGAWATTSWDAATNGAAIGIDSNQLSISGTATSWNDAYLHNNGASLVGGQYTIAAKMDFTNGYANRGAAIAVKNDQANDIASGAGSLFLDMNPTNGGADLYWELRYNSGSGMPGSEATISGAGKNTYDVELRINETGATKTAALVVDGSTIYTLNWDPGSNANRYIGLGYNTTYGGTMKFDGFSLSGTIAPEPCALVVLCTGLLGLLAYAWRKRK
jgi:hypothetical protein